MSWRRFPAALEGGAVRSLLSLSGAAIQRPVLTLCALGLVTLAAAPGVARLKLRTDGRALLSPAAPEVVYDQGIRHRFGVEDQMVVLVQAPPPEGIFNPATLQRVRELTSALKNLPGVSASNVMSLATEPSFRLRPGTLSHQTLLEPPLRTRAELDQLREDLRRIELYTGTLVSSNGLCTAILVGVPEGADRAKLYERVRELVAAQSTGPEAIAVTGAPAAESLLGLHILEDLGVPPRLLGVSTRGREGGGKWRLPRSGYELRALLAHSVGLVPVVLVVMTLVLWVSFRRPLAVLLALSGAGATIVFVFGFMGWCGIPLYLTIAVMPVLLVATGVTNDIYLFSRYFSLLRDQPGDKPQELLRETFRYMVRPLAGTSLTTGLAFLTFGLSPIMPVRVFGACTALGVLFGMLYSFTAVPALLALIRPAWLVRPRPVSAEGGSPTGGRGSRFQVPGSRFSALGVLSPTALQSWFAALGGWLVARRWWVTGLMLALIAVTPLGLRRLVVQDSWTNAFDPSSEFYRATRRVNEQFDGMHLLFVACEAPQVVRGELPASDLTGGGLRLPGNLVDAPALIAGSTITLQVPAADNRADATNGSALALCRSHLEMATALGTNIVARLPGGEPPAEFLEACARAGKFRFELGVRSQLRPELVRELGRLGDFIRARRDCAVGGVLGPADYLATTRFMARPNDPAGRALPQEAAETKLMWDFYGLARGPHRLRQVVDTNYWTSLTTVFLKDANFVDTARLMSAIRGYERVHFAPQGIRLGFAGDVAVSQSLIRGIVATQVQSLLWSAVGIWLVTALLGGSLRWGLYCVLPSLLAVLVKFAVMGWSDIPLGVATSMFAAMTLGIGVNCAIQLLEGEAQARTAGLPGPEALRRALALTGPPALLNTVAVSLGFAVLMLSQVPANARLGLLVVLGLVNCFVVSMLVLPLLLHWWPLRGGGGKHDEREAQQVVPDSREGGAS